MLFNTNKEKGRAGMALGIAYFGANGYTVNVPLNDTQWYDFVIEKDGIFQTVQCKATGSKDGRIDFRSTGGTNGSQYDHLNKHFVDFLFCINQDGIMYCIPHKDIPNANGIALKTEPNKNNQGFESYKYIVSL